MVSSDRAMSHRVRSSRIMRYGVGSKRGRSDRVECKTVERGGVMSDMVMSALVLL